MELKFWIWLVIIVATFLIQRMRKAPRQGEPNSSPGDSRDNDSTTSGKPLTFDELMREIQQAQGRPETPPPVAIPTSKRQEYVDYDDDVEPEYIDRELVPARNEDKSLEIYEKAKKDAFAGPSLEETMKVEDTIVKFSHFKGYEGTEQKGFAVDVLKEFQDPDGFKKAFIMSEILKRKF
jgi:hypothetical protein